MNEIIQLIRYENNKRLGSHCLSDQNDHWNSNLSKNRPTCVFIGSFSINDVAIFGCVIDKQYESLSDLIVSFGTAKNQITFYRHKYWNTQYTEPKKKLSRDLNGTISTFAFINSFYSYLLLHND